MLLGRIRKRAESLPKEDGKGAGRVLAALEADRAEAYDELLKALRSERYVALLDRLIESANAPAFQSEHDLDAKAALQPLVAQPLETLAKQVSSLDKDPTTRRSMT